MADLADRLRGALGERYVLERELGRGGMAVVFLARDLRYDRRVALKVLKPEIASALGPERFLREIGLAARLNHPHLLPLLDSGQIPGEGAGPLLYYAMPFVEGETLRDRLEREGPLGVAESIRITAETADALAYLHGQGVVHRDIKPENIMLSGGHAVVSDLGISRILSAVPSARLTETGMVLGTAAYMSPEQAMGESRVDGRTDIYALGCVLYELLAGEPPFMAPTAQAMIARRLTEPVPPLTSQREVPPELEGVLHRALARSPADRYATAGDFARALTELPIQPHRVATPVPAPAAPAGLGSRRRLAWLAIPAVVAVLAVLALVLLRTRRGGVAAAGGAPAAGSIAVLPFVSPSNDSSLVRVGRELSSTLSATLDGIGELRAIDRLTVLARWGEDAAPLPLSEDAARARALGAAAILQGSLVRSGELIRIDFSMTTTDSLRPLARGTWTGPAEINAMTDSVSRMLLRQIWRNGTAPTPSLDGALRTRSVAALRAFLEGEQDVGSNRWEEAVGAYNRALEADSGFYLAASRLLLSRYWSLQGEDPALGELVRGHLAELPPRERLLTGAYLAHDHSSTAALDAASDLVHRYPDYWLGWLFYGDWQFHDGPGLGHPLADAGPAFEQALALNPALLPAWDHLGLLTAREGDRVGLERVLRNLDSLHARPVLAADGFGDHVLLLRVADRELAGDSAGLAALIDSAAVDYLRRPAGSSFFDPMTLRHFATQVRVYRAAARLTARGFPGRAPATSPGPWDETTDPNYWPSRAWMGRGAWDSATAILGRGGAENTLPEDRTMVLAAVVGAFDPAAVKLRPPESSASEADVAEFAWLNGILACLRGDRVGARTALQQLDTARGAGIAILRRSLRAHVSQQEGHSGAAAHELAGLELQIADSGYWDLSFAVVPAVDRFHAVHWLLATGDTATAQRLLAWGDASFQLGMATAYAIATTPLFDLMRAEVADRQGAVEAAAYYRRFLSEYDAPVAAHRHLVTEAAAALERLSHGRSAEGH